jgi:hypothetical protein
MTDRATSLLALVDSLPQRKRAAGDLVSSIARDSASPTGPLAPGWQGKSRAAPLLDDSESQLWRRLRGMGVVSPRNTVPHTRFIATQPSPSDVAFHLGAAAGAAPPSAAARRRAAREFGSSAPTLRDPATGTYLQPSAAWREKGRVFEADGSPRTANRETDPLAAYAFGTDLDSKKRRSPSPPPAAPPAVFPPVGGNSGDAWAAAAWGGGGGGGRVPRPFQAPAAPRPSPPPAALAPQPLLPAIPPLASARSPLGPPPAAGYFVGGAARAAFAPHAAPAGGGAPLPPRALSPTPPAHIGDLRIAVSAAAELPAGEASILALPLPAASPGSGGSRPGTPGGGGGGGSRPGTPGGGGGGGGGGGSRPGTPGGGGGGSRPGTPGGGGGGGSRPGTPGGGGRRGSSTFAAGGDVVVLSARPATPSTPGGGSALQPDSAPASAGGSRAGTWAAPAAVPFSPSLRPAAPPAATAAVAPLWTPRSLPALPLSMALLPSSLRHVHASGSSGEVVASELPRATSAALPTPEGVRRGLRRAGGEDAMRGAPPAAAVDGGAAGGGGSARARDAARATLNRGTLAALFGGGGGAPLPTASGTATGGPGAPLPTASGTATGGPGAPLPTATTTSIAAVGNSFHALPRRVLDAHRDTAGGDAGVAAGGGRPFTALRPGGAAPVPRGGVGGAALPPAHAHAPPFLFGVVDTSGSGHLSKSAWVGGDATAAAALTAAVAAAAATGGGGYTRRLQDSSMGGVEGPGSAPPRAPPRPSPAAPRGPSPPPPPPAMLRAGVATQGFAPASLSVVGVAGESPVLSVGSLRGVGDLSATGDLLGAPYGYTRDGGAYVRVDWASLAREALPSSRPGAVPPPDLRNERSARGIDGARLRPPPPTPLDGGWVGAVFSPLRSKTCTPLSAIRARNDPESARDWSADRAAGVNTETARGRPRWPAEEVAGPPSPRRPASVHAALRRHVGLRSGCAPGNGITHPAAEELLAGEPTGALARSSKRHLAAAARAPAGLPTPLEAAASLGPAGGGFSLRPAGGGVDGGEVSSPAPAPPSPLPADGNLNGPPTYRPLTAASSTRALALLSCAPPAGAALPHTHPYPPGVVPYVSQTDIHEAAEYVVSTLGMRQAALDAEAGAAARARADAPPPRSGHGRRLTDVQPSQLYARSALGRIAMAEVDGGARAPYAVAGLTLSPPASALPRALAAAAAAAARAAPRYATPLDVTLPPPLHALPLEGAALKTSLDGGDAAELEGRRARSASAGERRGAAARGDRARASAGAAQALGVLNAVAAVGLPHDRPRGVGRGKRPNSCPHRGWAGGPGPPPPFTAAESPSEAGALGGSPDPSLASLSAAASQWNAEWGLDGGGGGGGFGRSGGGGASPAAGARPPSWADAPTSPLRPATAMGLSRTASPRLLPPRTYGAALAQLSALSRAATARDSLPAAGGAPHNGLEYQTVNNRKGGVF